MLLDLIDNHSTNCKAFLDFEEQSHHWLYPHKDKNVKNSLQSYTLNFPKDGLNKKAISHASMENRSLKCE